jgi:hypothetical protein
MRKQVGTLLAAGLVLAVCFLSSPLSATETEVFPLDSADGLKLVGLEAEAVEYLGKKAVRLVPSAGADGEKVLAIVPGVEFTDGTIEVGIASQPLAGAGEFARGFVGVAFRVAPDLSAFECFYLRPTNGRADDQLRRNHSVQYISYPEYPWHRLRKETPGMYETYADLQPGVWTRVKIVVKGDKAKLFVNGVEQPTLIVNDLKHGESKGAVALWVGPGSNTHFTNLHVSR